MRKKSENNWGIWKQIDHYGNGGFDFNRMLTMILRIRAWICLIDHTYKEDSYKRMNYLRLRWVEISQESDGENIEKGEKKVGLWRKMRFLLWLVLRYLLLSYLFAYKSKTRTSLLTRTKTGYVYFKQLPISVGTRTFIMVMVWYDRRLWFWFYT